MKDQELPSGIFAKRHEKAPEFVICSLSIRKKQFIEYMQSMGGDDWLNLQVLRSKQGKIYVKVDTWEPDPAKTHQQGVEQVKQDTGLDDPGFQPDDDIPFSQVGA